MEQVAIRTASGEMDTFVTRPGGGGRVPAVILYMDMWGMREALYGLARRVAGAGYACLVPDLYYRSGKVRYAERDEPCAGISFAQLAPERQSALRAAMEGLSDAMVMQDTVSLLEFAGSGAVGAIGYCMGGRHVLCAAGSFPQRIAAAACIHGTALARDGEDSPHRLALMGRAELYFGHAERDKYAPADVVQRIDESLKKSGIAYRQVVHPGAQHGYAIPDRDVYDRAASERDWDAILAMFRRRLA